jgi:3-keto-disaccharide hydrolase
MDMSGCWDGPEMDSITYARMNIMIVECFHNSINMWVNGDFVNYGYDCTADKGQIALQAEGSEVEFRKVVLTGIAKFTECR